MYIFEFSRPARLFLVYGAFASLCHLCAVLFFAASQICTPADLLFHTVFPLLEHSLMSLTLVLFGTLGIEYVCLFGK